MHPLSLCFTHFFKKDGESGKDRTKFRCSTNLTFTSHHEQLSSFSSFVVDDVLEMMSSLHFNSSFRIGAWGKAISLRERNLFRFHHHHVSS